MRAFIGIKMVNIYKLLIDRIENDTSFINHIQDKITNGTSFIYCKKLKDKTKPSYLKYIGQVYEELFDDRTILGVDYKSIRSQTIDYKSWLNRSSDIIIYLERIETLWNMILPLFFYIQIKNRIKLVFESKDKRIASTEGIIVEYVHNSTIYNSEFDGWNFRSYDCFNPMNYIQQYDKITGEKIEPMFYTIKPPIKQNRKLSKFHKLCPHSIKDMLFIDGLYHRHGANILSSAHDIIANINKVKHSKYSYAPITLNKKIMETILFISDEKYKKLSQEEKEDLIVANTLNIWNIDGSFRNNY